MKKIVIAFVIFIACSVNSTAQTIIESESIVNFDVDGTTGTFMGMKGDITFDKNDLENSSFNTTIEASTVNTNNKKRDAHLKNADFFEVETYPSIAFKSSNIKAKGEKYVTTGTLSMHGVSKDVVIVFTVEEKDGKTIFNGDLKLDHSDYGIGKSKDVSIKIICVTKA